MIFLIWWQLIVTVVFRYVHASMAFVSKGEYSKCFKFEALLCIVEVFNELARL